MWWHCSCPPAAEWTVGLPIHNPKASPAECGRCKAPLLISHPRGFVPGAPPPLCAGQRSSESGPSLCTAPGRRRPERGCSVSSADSPPATASPPPPLEPTCTGEGGSSPALSAEPHAVVQAGVPHHYRSVNLTITLTPPFLQMPGTTGPPHNFTLPQHC